MCASGYVNHANFSDINAYFLELLLPVKSV